MRFPNTPFMWRTYDLAETLKLKWIDYIMETNNTFYYFNGHRVQASELAPSVDPFKVNSGAIPNYVDSQFVASNEPSTFIKEVVVGPIIAPFAAPNVDIEQAMTDMYQKYDKYSMRSYLFQLPKTVISSADVHYMETLDKSTGWYDRALTETAIESLAFDWPGTPTPEFDGKWHCFE